MMMLATVMGLVNSAVFAQGFVDVHVKPAPDHEVRYTSGKTIYVEGLVEDRWVGRYWTPSGRINFPYQLWAEDAFQLQVKDNPAPDAAPISLSKGWKWVSGVEAPKTERGARHFVVELSNTLLPVRVKVHTLLDGTSVLTRWLADHEYRIQIGGVDIGGAVVGAVMEQGRPGDRGLLDHSGLPENGVFRLARTAAGNNHHSEPARPLL